MYSGHMELSTLARTMPPTDTVVICCNMSSHSVKIDARQLVAIQQLSSVQTPCRSIMLVA